MFGVSIADLVGMWIKDILIKSLCLYTNMLMRIKAF